MSAAAGGISGVVVLRIARFVASHGEDPIALLAPFGLDREALGARHAWVPFATVEAIGERAGEMTGVKDIGLAIGRAIAAPETLEDSGILVLMASATVRSALERAVRFQALWGDGARFQLLPAQDGLRVRYVYPSESEGRTRHIDECALAEIVCGIRHLSGHDVRPRIVRFPHARPDDTSAHEALFDCPIEFGAAHAELVLDDATLDLRMRHAHEVFLEIFEREVERALASRPRARALAAQVRTIVRASMNAPEGVLGGTARALRTSRRTLQRRLREEGTSLGAIVDDVRLELAERYLAEDVPIKEVASMLGYAEPSAFHRAFKRWTGRTPDEHRAAR